MSHVLLLKKKLFIVDRNFWPAVGSSPSMKGTLFLFKYWIIASMMLRGFSSKISRTCSPWISCVYSLSKRSSVNWDAVSNFWCYCSGFCCSTNMEADSLAGTTSVSVNCLMGGLVIEVLVFTERLLWLIFCMMRCQPYPILQVANSIE